MEQITENVFIENRVRGCNPGFVVTTEGVVLIDTPIDVDYCKSWKKEIDKRGKSLFIINTEHHMDHFFGNSFFDGNIISHQLTRDTMLTIDIRFIEARTKVLYIDPFPIPAGHELKLPNITYTDHMTLHIGKHTFKILHTPGHTAGQSAVYIPEEKLVFAGDTVLGQTRTAVHDASLEKWIQSLKLIEALDVRYILPGHGSMVLDKKYLKTQADIVSGRLEAQQKAEAQGITLDEDELRKIDPFFNNRDTGMKQTVVLSSTSDSLATSKHG